MMAVDDDSKSGGGRLVSLSGGWVERSTLVGRSVGRFVLAVRRSVRPGDPSIGPSVGSSVRPPRRRRVVCAADFLFVMRIEERLHLSITFFGPHFPLTSTSSRH